jgi:hypothetical protein
MKMNLRQGNAALRKLGLNIVTFIPMGGGRLKCNQTGKKVRKSKIWGYRVYSFKLIKTITIASPGLAPKKAPEKEKLPEVKLAKDSTYVCPHPGCLHQGYSFNELYPYEHTCPGCSKKFIITGRVKPAPSWSSW